MKELPMYSRASFRDADQIAKCQRRDDADIPEQQKTNPKKLFTIINSHKTITYAVQKEIRLCFQEKNIKNKQNKQKKPFFRPIEKPFVEYEWYCNQLFANNQSKYPESRKNGSDKR